MFSVKPNQTIDDIDSLIMTLTRIVEDKLRSTLARKLGRAVARSKSFGIALLDYSVNSHLIANKDEAIYSLLKLMLKDPRNTSHHTFRNYPYKTLVMFLSEINEALESIDGLAKPSYLSYLKTNYDPATKKLALKPKY